MAEPISTEDRRRLLEIARQTITAAAAGDTLAMPREDRPLFGEKRGVFVTLQHRGNLRGCIGYPLPIKSLLEAVVDNARAAALEDPRFPMVKPEEVKDLDIEISILTPPREVTGADAVQVGRDGIIITKGFSRGLLLPQVPLEQGWDRDEFLSYGCRKAGLAPDEWKRGVKIETFEAVVFSERQMDSSGT